MTGKRCALPVSTLLGKQELKSLEGVMERPRRKEEGTIRAPFGGRIHLGKRSLGAFNPLFIDSFIQMPQLKLEDLLSFPYVCISTEGQSSHIWYKFFLKRTPRVNSHAFKIIFILNN